MGLLAKLRFDGGAGLVTGAASGIGRACAESLAECGAHVVLVDIAPRPLEETARVLRDGGATVETHVVDVTDEQAVAALFAAVARHSPPLRAVINNAGSNHKARITDLDLVDWERLLRLNLTSMFLMCKAAIPVMLASGRPGSIVNVASGFALIGGPDMPAYAASKAGVVGLTRQLAFDYGPSGVRVNTLCPGATLTPRVRAYFDSRVFDKGPILGRIPLGRCAEPAEIAAAATFLASDAASFVHGATLAVDGGQSAT